LRQKLAQVRPIVDFVHFWAAFAANSVRLDSPPGEYVGGGVVREYTDANAAFRSTCNANSALIGIDSNAWSLDFSGPQNGVLVPDVYESVTLSPFQSPQRSGQRISGNGISCTQAFGRFVVREFACSAANTVERLAIDAEQRCQSQDAPPLFAYVRINSTIPVLVPQPTASAGNDQAVDEGQTVTLDGSKSTAQGGLTSVIWRQLQGPVITLSDVNTLTPSFIAPEVAPAGATITMELAITNAAGLSDSNTVNIHVRDSNDPRMRVLLEGGPDVVISGGARQTFDESDYLFSGGCNAGRASVSLYGGPLHYWTMDFASEPGKTLAVDVYEGAATFPDALPHRPALKISGSGFWCSSARRGRFVVREITCDGNGSLSKLAVDATQYCGSEESSALHAYIRFNSPLPLVVTHPTASAGIDQVVDAGQIVTLDGSTSAAVTAIAGYHWRQLSGPAVNLSNATAVKPTFTAPDVPLAGDTATFELVVTDASGQTDANRVDVLIRNRNGPRTLLTIDSRPGDYVGGGVTTRLTDLDANFSGTCDIDSARVSVNYEGWWTLDFAARAGSPLVADVYENATRYPFQSPRGFGLDISGNGRGCNGLQGRFIVRELVCSATGVIEQLAIDAEQNCSYAPLFAYLRLNSTIPEVVPQPTASAGVDQEVQEGDTVVLDGSKTSSPDSIAAVLWQQISGPAASLSHADILSPTFVAPEVGLGGATLTFELTVTGSSGLTDRNRVDVTVRDRADQRTLLTMVSHPGDYIGGGSTFTLTDFDTSFASDCTNTEARVNLYGSSWWWFDVAAPVGAALQGGTTYENATRYPFQPANAPGLSVSGNGAGCNASYGRFTVREFSCNTSGKVERLAIDAEQHCEIPGAPPLFAFLRVNSAIPVPDDVDRGCRLDVDGNGQISSRYDASALLRGLAGLSGSALQGMDIAPGATRYLDWQLDRFLRGTCAAIPRSVGPSYCSLDLDGDGKVQLTTDGVIATRIIAGQKGDSVLANALGAGATRRTWAQLTSYLAACNLLLTP